MSIDTWDACLIAKKPYTLVLKHYDWVKEEIDKLLETGVIRENHSSWSAWWEKVVCGLQGLQCNYKDLYVANAQS